MHRSVCSWSMSCRPVRSPGILVSRLGDSAVAHDLVTETLHRLNLAAGAVLARCDGSVDVDDLATVAAGPTAVTATVRAEVARIVDTFAELGLVDRDVPFVPPEPVTGSTEPATRGDDPRVAVRTVGLLDRAVMFRGPRVVVDDVVDHVGLPPRPGGPDALVVDVFADAPGRTGPGSDGDGPDLSVGAPDDRDRVVLNPPAFADGRPVGGRQTRRPMSLHERVGSVLNRFAAGTGTCLALHTGGVRTPDGRIVLVPATSGSGKSTLTAALVAAGCDLLGDEVVGLDLSTGDAVGYPRRISLDATSRRALGLPADPATPERDGGVDPADIRPGVERLSGAVGPVSAVVSPRFVAGAGFVLEPVGVDDAFDQLLANTLNLARVGQPGLDMLCQVAETAVSYRLVHGDALGAARRLLDGL